MDQFYLLNNMIEGLESTFDKKKWSKILSTQKKEWLILTVDEEKGFMAEVAFRWVLKNDKILIAWKREKDSLDQGGYVQE